MNGEKKKDVTRFATIKKSGYQDKQSLSSWTLTTVSPPASISPLAAQPVPIPSISTALALTNVCTLIWSVTESPSVLELKMKTLTRVLRKYTRRTILMLS